MKENKTYSGVLTSKEADGSWFNGFLNGLGILKKKEPQIKVKLTKQERGEQAGKAFGNFCDATMSFIKKCWNNLLHISVRYQANQKNMRDSQNRQQKTNGNGGKENGIL